MQVGLCYRDYTRWRIRHYVAYARIRILGVIFTKDLKFSQRCFAVCSATTKKKVGFIAPNFEYKRKDNVLFLHKSLVCPHLEYAFQFWSPHLWENINNWHPFGFVHNIHLFGYILFWHGENNAGKHNKTPAKMMTCQRIW